MRTTGRLPPFLLHAGVPRIQFDASLPGGPCWGAGCLTVPEWLLHDHHVIINLAHASVPLKVTNLARRLAFT